jgi:hypothetical protein
VNGNQIVREAEPFLDWIATWYDRLPTVSFQDAVRDASRAAVFSTDLIAGFCSEGPLASERVNAVVPRVTALFREAHHCGVRRFVLAQDTHERSSPEFQAWPPHCVRGSRESRMVPELEALPFSSEFVIFEKNALSPAIGTGFESWLGENDDLRTYLVTGDCTDLCVYQLAMFLRMWMNATNRPSRDVIVPAGLVDTYDLPVSGANGAFPHDGNFSHMYFLYHMALNGIRVVRALE